MNTDILQFIVDVKKICNEQEFNTTTLNHICQQLYKNVNSPIMVLDKHCDIIFKNALLSDDKLKILQSPKIFEIEQRAFLHDPSDESPLLTVPLGAFPNECGFLVVYRNGSDFSTDELACIEIVSLVITMIIKDLERKNDFKANNDSAFVKSAIGALSYSELNAIIHIFNELNGSEGYIVASKVAKKYEITRSILINAIRKLEGAGLLESRSLGVKGTYLKVLNEVFLIELKKLKL